MECFTVENLAIFVWNIFWKKRTETALIKFLASILSLHHRNDMIFDELGDDKRWNYSYVILGLWLERDFLKKNYYFT